MTSIQAIKMTDVILEGGGGVIKKIQNNGSGGRDKYSVKKDKGVN